MCLRVATFPHQDLLLLAPLDGQVTAELRKGDSIGSVSDDDAVDDCGREAREADGPRIPVVASLLGPPHSRLSDYPLRYACVCNLRRGLADGGGKLLDVGEHALVDEPLPANAAGQCGQDGVVSVGVRRPPCRAPRRASVHAGGRRCYLQMVA